MTSEPADNRGYSPAALWSLLDPADPGLEEMAAAMAAGDGEAAESAYLSYQRRREAPVLPWIDSGGSPQERRAAFDFLTETPRQLTWRDRERGGELVSLDKGYTSHRLEGIRPSPYNVVELADLLLANKVMLVYHPEDGVQDLGPEWNWEHVPPGDGLGRRWTLSLPYQYFLFALGRRTGPPQKSPTSPSWSGSSTTTSTTSAAAATGSGFPTCSWPAATSS